MKSGFLFFFFFISLQQKTNLASSTFENAMFFRLGRDLPVKRVPVFLIVNRDPGWNFRRSQRGVSELCARTTTENLLSVRPVITFCNSPMYMHVHSIMRSMRHKRNRALHSLSLSLSPLSLSFSEIVKVLNGASLSANFICFINGNGMGNFVFT